MLGHTVFWNVGYIYDQRGFLNDATSGMYRITGVVTQVGIVKRHDSGPKAEPVQGLVQADFHTPVVVPAGIVGTGKCIGRKEHTPQARIEPIAPDSPDILFFGVAYPQCILKAYRPFARLIAGKYIFVVSQSYENGFCRERIDLRPPAASERSDNS